MARFLLGFVVGFLVALVVLLSIGNVLRVSDGPRKTDVIVALSPDAGARADYAVILYRAGYAPLMLFSGGAEDPGSTSAAAIMRRRAIAAGVSDGAIVIEPRARTMEEHARFLREVMEERKLTSALLVTSEYEQRRAAIEFSRAFAGTELTFANVPARDPLWDATFWWLDPAARDLTIRELANLSLALLSR